MGSPAALGSAPPLAGAEPTSARKLRLVARHRLGVPVHDSAKDRGSFRRVPGGSEAVLLAEAGGRWLHVRFADGSEGYITTRYVAEPWLPGSGGSGSGGSGSGGPDRERTCARARQRTPAPDEPEAARVASFNVRWFPDGQPGKKVPVAGGTDLAFLACTLADTGAEVVLVQEFKRGARAEEALQALLRELGVLTGGSWQARFDDCKNETAQHVGVLFDQKRARPLGPARTVAELNPLGGACTGSLRPGLLQRFRLSTGLVVDSISVHLKSGTDARSAGLREQTFARLARAFPASSQPLVVGGDFNTMGCEDCVSPLSAADERRRGAEAGLSAGLRLVEPSPACSHYRRGQPGLLDGFFVRTKGASRVEAQGACAELACQPDHAERHGALDLVSDHCPLVLSLPAP